MRGPLVARSLVQSMMSNLCGHLGIQSETKNYHCAWDGCKHMCSRMGRFGCQVEFMPERSRDNSRSNLGAMLFVLAQISQQQDGLEGVFEAMES